MSDSGGDAGGGGSGGGDYGGGNYGGGNYGGRDAPGSNDNVHQAYASGPDRAEVYAKYEQAAVINATAANAREPEIVYSTLPPPQQQPEPVQYQQQQPMAPQQQQVQFQEPPQQQVQYQEPPQQQAQYQHDQKPPPPQQVVQYHHPTAHANGPVLVVPNLVHPSQQVALQRFGRHPQNIVCPVCHNGIRTRTHDEMGVAVIVSVIILILLFWPLFWIPLICQCCKKTNHYCPHCNTRLGVTEECTS